MSTGPSGGSGAGYSLALLVDATDVECTQGIGVGQTIPLGNG